MITKSDIILNMSAYGHFKHSCITQIIHIEQKKEFRNMHLSPYQHYKAVKLIGNLIKLKALQGD